MQLIGHPSRQLSERARSTPGAIDLTVGEPFYGPPARVLDRLAARLTGGPAGYAPSLGDPALRRSIARYVARIADVAVDPARELLITVGAAEALWLTVLTTTEPGDEVLLPDPAYALYELVIRALDRQPVRVPTDPAAGFALPVAALEHRRTPRARLLIINAPGNPTGAVYDAAAIQALADWTRAAGLTLLHDEVLDFASFAPRHASALAVRGGRDHIVSINSFSKRLGLAGWRVGWLVAPPAIVERAAQAHTLVALAAPAPLQDALADALDHPLDPEHLAQLARGSRDARAAWQRAASPAPRRRRPGSTCS